MKKIEVAGRKEILICDHAIVRYLERVKGMDMGELKKEILPDVVEKAMKKLGVTGMKFKLGTHTVIVEDRILKTILFE